MSSLHKGTIVAALVGSFAALIVALTAAVIASGVGDPEPATRDDLGEIEARLAQMGGDLRAVTDAAANSTSDVSGVAERLRKVTRGLDALDERVAAKGKSIRRLESAVSTLQDQIEPVERFIRRQAEGAS